MSKPDPIQHATAMAAMWLNRANEAAERGEHEKAERHYERSQKWHDRMIELSGEA